MKFNLNDFLQLDTKALLAVNGGTHCGGGSGRRGYSSSSGNNSYGSRGGGGSYGGSGGGSCSGSSSGGISGGGGNCGGTNNSGSASSGVSVSTVSGGGNCSKFDLIPFIKGINSDTDSASTGVSGAGICGGTTSPTVASGGGINSKTQNSKKETDGATHITTSRPNAVHCDVIAWNHAVDAGLDPRGKDGCGWDADNKNVDQIFNSHFATQAVSFDSGSAGKSGYLFYDWEGNGHYDHVEFCRINSDGSSYSYYSNNGFEGAGNEIYKTNISFKNDSNAHAQVFVP